MPYWRTLAMEAGIRTLEDGAAPGTCGPAHSSQLCYRAYIQADLGLSSNSGMCNLHAVGRVIQSL